MNADTFYKNFEEALEYLGATWDDKELVSVTLVDNKLLFEYCGREAAFKVTELRLDATREQFELECG